MSVALGVAVVAMVADTLVSGSARAAAFRDWAVECATAAAGGSDTCVLAQTVAADDRTWLATVRLRPLEDGAAALQVLVPPGVHLASGLFAQAPGGAPVPLAYQRCASRACEGLARMDAAEVARWRGARAAEIVYRPSVVAPPVRFAISLMGISAALDDARAGGTPE